EGPLRSWDPTKGADTRILAQAFEGAERLATNLDGSRVAVAGKGQFVLLDPAKGTPVATSGHKDDAMPTNLALSPDGSLVAVSTTEGLEIRKTSDGSVLRRLIVTASAGDRLAFDPASEHIAIETADGVRLYDAKNDKEPRLLKGGSSINQPFARVSFRADGLQLAARGMVWDLSDGKSARDDRDNSSGLFAPRGTRFISPRGGTIQVTDPLQAVRVRTLNVGGAMAPDGRRILTVLPGNHVLDVDSGKSLFHLGDVGSRYFDVAAYRPDGKQFACADREDEVHLWDARSVTSGRTIKLRSVVALSFTLDSKYLIAVVGPRRGFPENASLTVPRSVVYLDSGTGEIAR
ncbi:WD40 repeat domain-containing protein, partial [Singulisphaera rosea]